MKYNYYPGYDPELYDLESDPGELFDLGRSIEHGEIRHYCHEILETLVQPEDANQQAFADQRELIDKLGGVAAILGSEEYDFTPVEN